MSFTVNFTTRWADFDANIHMRHTAYNDYCAEVRMRYFMEFGISIKDFTIEQIGPILFEENTKFLKEIHLGENISANLKITGLSKNAERWKLQHEVFNEKGQLSAVVNVYGAWLDLTKRKLTTPPQKFIDMLKKAERSEFFEAIPMKNEK